MIAVLEYHRVQLDAFEPRLGGGVYTVEHLVEITHPRDALEAFRAQRVEADIDALDTRIAQRTGQAPQL